jgi:hypothetical protein
MLIAPNPMAQHDGSPARTSSVPSSGSMRGRTPRGVEVQPDRAVAREHLPHSTLAQQSLQGHRQRLDGLAVTREHRQRAAGAAQRLDEHERSLRAPPFASWSSPVSPTCVPGSRPSESLPTSPGGTARRANPFPLGVNRSERRAPHL